MFDFWYFCDENTGRMKNYRIVLYFLLFIGIILFLGGLTGSYSLYKASQKYERTTGVVCVLQTKKVYRHRKLRYYSQMTISYPTSKYGNVRVSMESYDPFRKKGDELPVWYHPERPREVRLPKSEGCLWGFFIVAGMACIYVGFPRKRKPIHQSHTQKQEQNNIL